MPSAGETDVLPNPGVGAEVTGGAASVHNGVAVTGAHPSIAAVRATTMESTTRVFVEDDLGSIVVAPALLDGAFPFPFVDQASYGKELV